MTNTPAVAHMPLNSESGVLWEVSGSREQMPSVKQTNMPPLLYRKFSICTTNAYRYLSSRRPIMFYSVLKLCEGGKDIAYNIYTRQDHRLNGPHGGPEVAATWMRRFTLCQLLSDRQPRNLAGPVPFGRCHAQVPPRQRAGAKTIPRRDSSVGLGPSARKKKSESWQLGRKGDWED